MGLKPIPESVPDELHGLFPAEKLVDAVQWTELKKYYLTNAPEELQAIAALMPIADACLPQGQGLEGSPLGLRSILATAAFRLLAAHDGEGAS